MTRRALTSIAMLVSLIATPLAAQDAWSKVPAFPSVCYSHEDPFVEALEKASTDLAASLERQGETNSAVKARLDELDMATKQTRLVAFLQKDPVAAQKFMQDMAKGEQAGEILAAMGEQRERLKQKLDEAEAKWQEEIKPLAPLQGEYLNEAQPGGNAAKARAAATQFNAAYQQLCPRWFTASDSPFLAYLAEFKRFVVEDLTPSAVESTRIQKLPFGVYGVPSEGLRTTEDLNGIHEYLEEVRKIFDKRQAVPIPIR